MPKGIYARKPRKGDDNGGGNATATLELPELPRRRGRGRDTGAPQRVVSAPEMAPTLDNGARVLGVDNETIRQFALDIINGGSTPRSVLEEKYGPSKTSACIAILYRTNRLLREAPRPTDSGNVICYEWADKRFSKAALKKLPPYLGFIEDVGAAAKPRYADFQLVTTTCRWTNKVLGAVPMQTSGDKPMKNENGDVYSGTYNGFEREGNNIIIPANCVRAMVEKALPMIGKEKAVAYRIGYEAVRLKNVPTFIHVRGLIDKVTGQGMGLRHNEAIAPGQKFELTVAVPTTALSTSEWVRLLQWCGRFVRFSPGSSSAFGDFEVLSS